MGYFKKPEYIYCIFNIWKKINEKAEKSDSRRLFGISKVILNYTNFIIKESNIEIKEIPIEDSENINMRPYFEYISMNKIQLIDFKNVQITDIDISNDEDIERYVLSHIYYITQK
jgi:hypothetical protein